MLDSLGRIDILVNNAGVNIRGPIEELSEDDWDAVVDTNLKGPWLCCRAVAAVMKQQKWGRVINVSSMLGEISLPGRSPYASSKGGLTLLTKTLALEWAKDGINVNALCPGPFATEINTPLLNDPAAQRPDGSQRAAGPLGRPGRAGAGRRLPRVRRVELHDRRDPVHRRRLHRPMMAMNLSSRRRVRPSDWVCSAGPLIKESILMSDGATLAIPRGFRASGVKAGMKASGTLDLAVLAADRTVRGGRDLHDQPGLRRAGEVVPRAAARRGHPRRRDQLGQRQRRDRRPRAGQRRAHGRSVPRRSWAAGPSRSWSPRPA